MTFRYTTVREFIRACVDDRKVKNPHYTTSAFAKRIGLSAAMLTEVLKGRKFLSKERCYVVARELKLSETETEYLALLAEFETAKDTDLKDSLARRIRAMLPTFSEEPWETGNVKFLDKWYHPAILELTHLDKLPFTPEVLAEAIGITTEEAREALELLISEGLLKIDENGKARKIPGRVVALATQSSDQVNEYYRESLLRALGTLKTQTPDERYFASETFAVSSEGLSRIRALSDRFLNEVIEITKQCTTRDQVYQIGVQLFQVAKTNLALSDAESEKSETSGLAAHSSVETGNEGIGTRFGMLSH